MKRSFFHFTFVTFADLEQSERSWDDLWKHRYAQWDDWLPKFGHGNLQHGMVSYSRTFFTQNFTIYLRFFERKCSCKNYEILGFSKHHPECRHTDFACVLAQSSFCSETFSSTVGNAMELVFESWSSANMLVKLQINRIMPFSTSRLSFWPQDIVVQSCSFTATTSPQEMSKRVATPSRGVSFLFALRMQWQSTRLKDKHCRRY